MFDVQSEFTMQVCPLGHAAQTGPPQSTPVSRPSFTPSEQVGAAQVELMQIWPLAQACPQAPQLFESDAMCVSHPLIVGKPKH
jgi:hypothetical protein